jgi:hypothetical protein
MCEGMCSLGANNDNTLYFFLEALSLGLAVEKHPRAAGRSLLGSLAAKKTEQIWQTDCMLLRRAENPKKKNFSGRLGERVRR